MRKTSSALGKWGAIHSSIRHPLSAPLSHNYQRRCLITRCGIHASLDDPDPVWRPNWPCSCPFGRGGTFASFGVVGQTQVGAKNTDAGLAVLLPVIGQPSHGVHTRQAHRWLIVAELGCDRREPLVEHSRPV